MFVLNDCRTDARVLREAATLVAAGHEVTIIALGEIARDERVERESRDGFEIVRVPVPLRWKRRVRLLRAPWLGWRLAGWWVRDRLKAGPAGWLRLTLAAVATLVALPLLVLAVAAVLAVRLLPGTTRFRGGVDWLIRWQAETEQWNLEAARIAPDADVFHAHDLTALHAAVLARDRAGGQLVYDSHEIYLAAGSLAAQPGWVRRILRRREASWVRRADAVVTVNDAVARRLAARYAPARLVVVHNCPPRRWPGAGDPGPGPLRTAAGLRDESLVLYHGGFAGDRGLEELVAAAARSELDGVHVAFLGYGPLEAGLRALVAASPAKPRLSVLPAVPPDVLIDWVADADVAAMPIHGTTLNHRLSTPNKLFEALAAGVPVVASDLPEMRRIVIDDPDGPLGAVCDPTDPVALAAAIRSILELDPAARADLRARCLRAAHERWNWETESARLVGLYAELAGAPGDPRRPALGAA